MKLEVGQILIHRNKPQVQIKLLRATEEHGVKGFHVMLADIVTTGKAGVFIGNNALSQYFRPMNAADKVLYSESSKKEDSVGS